MSRLRNLVPGAAALALAITGAVAANGAAAQSAADEARFRAAQQRFDSEYRRFQTELDRYVSLRSSWNNSRYDDRYPPRREDDRYDPNYDAARYYRPGTEERVLTTDDRVYRGTDGRYYCQRSDGTTGLILGAGVGGVLGNVIDGGHSRTVGTLLGAAIGAVAGRKIDQNSQEVRCR